VCVKTGLDGDANSRGIAIIGRGDTASSRQLSVRQVSEGAGRLYIVAVLTRKCVRNSSLSISTT
jgi:hypothetical protein